MTETQYFYRVVHGREARLRALLNDIPFYKRAPQEFAITYGGGANHLLAPGENTLTLELFEAPRTNTVILEITIDHNHDDPVIKMEWPALCADLPAEAAGLPLVYTQRFRADKVTHLPAYMSCPPIDFGPEGTPELREAVRAFHAAVANADASSFAEELSLKATEMTAAYAGDPSCSADDARREMADFASSGVSARPLDFDELLFESRAGGRVAYVTRIDGGPAIQAISGGGDRLNVDLCLTRVNGVWRIFR